MDKKRGILNVSISIIFKLVILVVSIVTRRFLIRYVGNEANGLDSLYTSIVGVLSIAELGIGTAIVFCMYRPIVEGDTDKVSALYGLFKRVYLIIGGIIAVCGCLVMPLLPYLAKDYQAMDVNLYLTFGLMLISVVLTYAFSAKISLINAYKNNYITTTINSGGQLLQYGLQIIVLLCTQSFVWYLVCRIIAVAVQWGVTEVVAYIKYKTVIKNKRAIDSDTKKEVTKNVKAMFMHKIGGVLVNTADSIIISAFIGVVILGKYTNYTVIMTAMTGTITLFFTPLTSVIGHMCVEENKEQIQKYYNFFYVFNYILGLIFFLGYYSVIDNLVTICFGGNLEMAKSISLVITVNYFIQFMRQSTLLFKDATGMFYYDRWKPLIEGVLNIGLSIGFVYLFEYLWGAEFAVVGVIAATVVTNLTICHIVEPYVLYKHALQTSVKPYYIRNYLYIAVFIGLLFALHFSMIQNDNQWLELFSNGGISLAYSLTVSAVVVLINKDFRHYAKNFLLRLKRHKDKKLQTVVDTSGVGAEQTFEDVNISNENSIINEDANSDVVVEKDSLVVKNSDDNNKT